eukprot:scaffold36530_cov47-Attheya_sp.AAC.1
MEDYDDTYFYFRKSISRKILSACMRSLNDDGLIQKKGREPGQRGRIIDEYHVQNLSYLQNFIKDDKAYPHANEDYEIADSEESTDSDEAIPVSFDATYCRGYLQLARAVNFVLIYIYIHISPAFAVCPVLTSIIGTGNPKPDKKED